MKVIVSSTFRAPADSVWRLTRRSETLRYVTRGFLGFASAKGFPAEWQQGTTETTRLMFFGLIPGWTHRLTFTEVNDPSRRLHTREGGGLVPVWNHRIQIEPLQPDTCVYTDEVEVQAGPLTVPVWLYAQLFYRYRQLRWRRLLRITRTWRRLP